MKRVLLAAAAAALVLSGASAKAKKEKAPKAKKERAPKVKKTKAPKMPKEASFITEKGSGVVGCYTFNEKEIVNNEIIDHSGERINVYSNALDGSVLVEGKTGSGLRFDGDEYIDLDDSVLSGEGASFAAWVKPDRWIDWSRIFDVGDGKVADMWCGVEGGSGKLRVDIFGLAGGAVLHTDLPPAGEWSHVAVTFGDGYLKLYVNGTLADSKECAMKPAGIVETMLGLYVGRSNWPDSLFVGVMDNVVAANRVLTAEEIAELAK